MTAKTSEAGLVAAGGVTLEAWVKPTTVGGRGFVFGVGDAFVLESRPDVGYVLLTNSSNNPTPTLSISDADKVAVGWTHLAGTFAIQDLGNGTYSNTSSLYVNGVLADQVTGLSAAS